MKRRKLRPLGGIVALAVIGALGAGCSSTETDSTATEPTPSESSPSPSETADPAPSEPAEPTEPTEPPEPEDDRTTIDISVQDFEFTPSGESIDVPLGEEVELVITADAPGELHVHSSPEQFLDYAGTGQPESFTFVIDRPGQVEIESHDVGTLIVNLVVS